MRLRGVPLDVVADRVNASPETIERHYDKPQMTDKMENVDDRSLTGSRSTRRSARTGQMMMVPIATEMGVWDSGFPESRRSY